MLHRPLRKRVFLLTERGYFSDSILHSKSCNPIREHFKSPQFIAVIRLRVKSEMGKSELQIHRNKRLNNAVFFYSKRHHSGVLSVSPPLDGIWINLRICHNPTTERLRIGGFCQSKFPLTAHGYTLFKEV